MRYKSEAPDERDALVERLREFIRFGFATGPEAWMIVTAIFFVPLSKVITFNRQSVIGIF